MRRVYMLGVCLAAGVVAGWLTGRLALGHCSPDPELPVYGTFQSVVAREQPSADGTSGGPSGFRLASLEEAALLPGRRLVLPDSQRVLLFDERVTSWSMRMLPGRRAFVFMRRELPDTRQVQWLGYEFRPQQVTRVTPAEARLVLQHTTDLNRRQRAELRMVHLGLMRLPAFVGSGVFWTGPRVLVYDGSIYRPAPSILILAVAALGHSLLLWIGLAAAAGATLGYLSGIPAAVMRDMGVNLAGALWVAIGLRLLMALFFGDLWPTLAWHAPVVAPAAYVLAISLAARHRGHPRLGGRSRRG